MCSPHMSPPSVPNDASNVATSAPVPPVWNSRSCFVGTSFRREPSSLPSASTNTRELYIVPAVPAAFSFTPTTTAVSASAAASHSRSTAGPGTVTALSKRSA